MTASESPVTPALPPAGRGDLRRRSLPAFPLPLAGGPLGTDEVCRRQAPRPTFLTAS